MTLKPLIVAGMMLSLGACTLPPKYPALPGPGDAGAPAILAELARVASLSADQRRRELAKLESLRRLDDPHRFQLAALLEREDSVEALERGLKNLNAMGEADARTQALVELMKKSLKARIELRQQTARTQELQDKLDQIKALEKSLQQRNEPARNP